MITQIEAMFGKTMMKHFSWQGCPHAYAPLLDCLSMLSMREWDLLLLLNEPTKYTMTGKARVH